MIHSQEMPFACEECGRNFRDKKSLKLHFKCHLNDRQYPCPYCDYKGISNGRLRNHLKYVHVNKSDLKEMKCEFCPKLFTKTSQLRLHIDTVHRGIKSHKCPNCERSFAKVSNLKDHIMTHTGQSKWKCDVCGKGFIQKTPYKQHMKNNHGIVI